MIVRIFDTAMDPADVEKGKELFRQKVRPAFDSFAGCHGVEMVIGVEEHSQDLVDIASISRWDSIESIEQATTSDDYKEALEEIRKLFQQAPIVRHFELTE
ncbi:MAG TPA: antibiotic biosynthesis monooxygenase [Actinomycetota bacterium]|nr:antibiotic biosynthesis monooxygenase [Actinomycetota bacterium]